MRKFHYFLLAFLMLFSAARLSAQTSTLTVADGSESNSFIPIYGSYLDENMHSQIIYPAAMLTDMVGGSISSLTFYMSNVPSSPWTNIFQFSVGTTSQNVFEQYGGFITTGLTEVYSGTVAVGAQITVNFTTPYQYQGGNLVVDVLNETTNASSYTGFFGIATGGYSSRIAFGMYGDIAQLFIPKTTFAFTGGVSCRVPVDLSVSDVNMDAATLSWTPRNAESSWDIYLTTGNTDVPDATTTPTYTATTPTYTFQNLVPVTDYMAYVRANCGAGDYSQWVAVPFRTAQVPAQLPYSCDFEDMSENSQWALEGDGVNQWSFGAAANHTESGAVGLYISNDEGVSNAYSINAQSTAWAYRDFNFDNSYAEYNLSFYCKTVGQNSFYDYLKVYLGPPALPPTSATMEGALPEGATLVATFTNQPEWTEFTTSFSSQYTGTQRLYFLWWNNNGSGYNPPAAIDDLTITGVTCGSPYGLALYPDGVTETSISFHFSPATPLDYSWEALLLAPGDTIDESQVVQLSDTSHIFSNLQGDTPYRIYVRTNCGSEFSAWSQVLEVRTDCSQYMNIPYAESFDSYGSGNTNAFPACWQRLYTTYNVFPYLYNYVVYSAPGSLYFYSESSQASCAIAPEVDTVNHPINSLSVYFRIKKPSNYQGYGALQVGVMSDPTNLSTFTPVHTFTGEEWADQYTWYEVEVPLTAYTGSGSYIALVKTASSGYTCVDDFKVYPTPTCLKPTDVALSSITDNSVTVSWTARGEESAWQVAVVPAGTDVNQVIAEVVYTNPCTISNLIDNTAYEVYVKADCGDESSEWTDPIAFSTRCLPTSSMPYTESFEGVADDNATLPNCWSRLTNSSAEYPYVSAAYSSDSTASLYLKATSSNYSLAASQALDLSIYAANSLLLNFKAYKTSSYYGRLDVGVMTDPGDLETMTVLRSIYPSDYDGENVWTEFAVPLTCSHEAGNLHLVFLAPSGSSNEFYVDEVVLDFVPECSVPTNLQISQVEGSSALLSWTAAPYGAVDYTVEYTVAEADSWTVAESSVAGTFCFISGLSPETTYEARVIANCNSGSMTSDVVSFTTGCLAGGDLTVGDGTTTSFYLPTYSNYNYALSQQLYTANEVAGITTVTGLKLNLTSSTHTPRTWDIYLGNVTQSQHSAFIPTVSHTKVFSGTVSLAETGWLEINFDTLFTYTGGSVVLTIDDNTGSYSFGANFAAHQGIALYAYHDVTNYNPLVSNNLSTENKRNDVVFVTECDDNAGCVAPNVTIASVAPNAITIDWAIGYAESTWELEYKTVADTGWTNMGSVTERPYTLENLSADTEYMIRMRSDCGGEYSVWKNLDAHTLCDYISTLPYIQNFDVATGSGSGHFISCWNKGTNASDNDFPYTNSTKSRSQPYSLFFSSSSSYYSYATTHRFSDDIDVSNLQVTFYALKTSYSGYIEVGVMTDPNDLSTFTLISTFTPSTTEVWEMVDVNLINYQGEGRYIAFRMPQSHNSQIYIDDVDIHEMPFCERVEDVVASQITANSATVSWTPLGTESNWEVLYAPMGTIDYENTIPEIVSGAPSIVLSNLAANTVYDVAVRAICDDGGIGAWCPGTFRTGCGDITVLPFTENFDTFEAGIGNTINCWTRSSSQDNNYPYVYASSAFSGTNALYFYSASNAYSAIAMPPLAESIQANTLDVTFRMRADFTTSRIVVGVMSDPSDAATFVPMDTVAISVSNVWEHKSISLESYTGTGRYVAFRNLNVSYEYVLVDDVTLSLRPACARPYDLEVVASSSEVVSLAWTDPVGSMWDLIYGPTGFDPDNSVESTLVPGLSATVYDVPGLTPGVIYDFYVRSDCGGDVSPWCYVPATSTPYLYVMDAPSDTITACGMTIVDNGGIMGDYSNSSNNVLVIYPAEPDSLLSISGTFVGEVTGYDFLKIYEGVGVNEENILATVSSGTGETEVEFGPFVSELGPITLRFYSNASGVYEGFVATVNCVSAPTCRKPISPELVSVTSTTANLRWNTMNNDYAGFNVAVSTESVFSPDTCVPTYTMTPQVQVTGLTPNTLYFARVQTDCSNGDVSEWSDEVISFRTAANTAQVPYLSNFSDSTEIADWLFVNGAQANQWYIGTPTNATRPVLFISNDQGVTNDYTTETSSYVWACRDIAFGNFSEHQISFKWKGMGEECCDYLRVFIGNPALPANTNNIPEGAVQISQNLNMHAVDTVFTATVDASYSNTVKRLYFLWRNDNSMGATPAISVDSVQVVGVDCGRPYNLNLDDITTTTADITFTPANSSDVAWEYVFGLEGCDPAALYPNPISDTIIQLSGLANNNTAYDLYVRTVCAGGEYSDWSNVLSFNTLCGSIGILPYTEDFNDYGTGVDAYPPCWSKLSSFEPYPYISMTNHSAPGAMEFYNYQLGSYNIAIMPEIDTDQYPMNSLEVTFWHRGYAASNLVVGVMSDPENPATFVPVDTVYGQVNWTEHLVYLASYTGTGRYVAFKCEYAAAANSGYLDDVTIDAAPTCLPVINVSTSDISQNSATIAWTDVSNAIAWNVEYGPTGFTPGFGTMLNGVSNPCTINGLMSSTTYDVYVQSVCSATDVSEWGGVYTFTTECDLITTLPYTEDFNAYTATTTSPFVPNDYPNDVLPTCWSFLNRSADPFASPSVFLTSYSTYASTGNCLFFRSSATTPLYAVLPAFAEDIQNLQITFKYRNEGASDYNGTLSVGYMTDPENAATYTEVFSCAQNTTLAETTVLFDSVPASVTNAFIVFRYSGGLGDLYALSIDDVVVDEIQLSQPCDAPTNLQVTPAETSATVTWTSAASAWVVEYKEASASAWVASSTLYATSYTIMGLTSSTDYQVRVKAICSNANESDWSAIASFTTLDIPVMTYTITATATGPGSITPSGAVTVQEGSGITFSFVADAGAVVSNLLVDEVSTAIPANNSYTFTSVVSNHTITVEFEEETGIEELDLDAAVVLYPNPATSHIQINVADARFLGAEMQIFDAYGKLIANTTIETLSTQVDVSQLANGMYMVRIRANDGMVTKRFVKR